MERTQIYLEAEQRRVLSKMAKQKGSTFSGLVRDAISSYIEREHHDDVPKYIERIEDHPIWQMLEEIWAMQDSEGPTTYGSTTYKEALYGGDRPWPESS